MISGIQFYENGVPNIMQNRGNDAIVKQVPLQPSPLWGENVGKIYSTWIFGITFGNSTVVDCERNVSLEIGDPEVKKAPHASAQVRQAVGSLSTSNLIFRRVECTIVNIAAGTL
jgi:hypothetical protein